MIHLDKVTKRYGGTVAVNELSMEVNGGEVCVLIGPSGCGKTTTLRMINRLIEPTSGHIYVNDRDISNIKPEQLRRSIGYAIQSVGLFPHMTVADNIAIVPNLLHWEKSRISGRIEELLALVGLNPVEHAQKYPNQLSGGEAQRVGVARALAADPPILLMDEPFGAVDPLTREKLQSQFLSVQEKLRKTVILVTHDLDEAIRLADRIAIMEAGKLVQYDTPESILSKPKNKFVHDFVGTDRALKRLSRRSIKDLVKPSASIRISATATQAKLACEKCRWVWVVDETSKLIGWLDRENLSEHTPVKEAMVHIKSEDIAVTDSATLRDALSRMLGQGVRSIPVIDSKGNLIGEVTMSDIEKVTADTEV